MISPPIHLARRAGERDVANYLMSHGVVLPTPAPIAMKLASDPDFMAELGGNCDGIGSTDYNIVLGQKRADAARGYLVSYGKINLGRMQIRTFGKDAPVATNDTDAGRQKNRNVTINILSYSK